MKRGLALSCIAMAVFLLSPVAGARIDTFQDKFESGPPLGSKTVETHLGGNAAEPRTYRSPGSIRKVAIGATESYALAQAVLRGAVEIADYGSFKLFAIGQPALDSAVADWQGGREAVAGTIGLHSTADNQRVRSGLPFTVRDDYNLLLLRSGAIDTTEQGLGGRFLGLDLLSADRAINGPSPAQDISSPLRLIQFAGPVKPGWLDEIRAEGLEPIAYVPNNGYLVTGGVGASKRIARLAARGRARGEAFVQWEGPFLEEHKVHPALAHVSRQDDQAELMVAVQLARDLGGPGITAGAELQAVTGLASTVIVQPYEVLGFTVVRLRVPAGRISQIAALHSVINIEPWAPPMLADERAAQIIAGQLTDDHKEARAPGYLAWLQSHSLAKPFSFAIDVTDTGLDQGTVSADRLHRDFKTSAGQSRITYASDYTSELDPGDVQGHGSLNLSIAGGSAADDGDMRDDDGFIYGLGVAPFAQLGSAKIFQSSGRFDLVDPYSKVIADGYNRGARISSNSWAAITNSYTLDSQEYDARVRDALPAQPGNQEMVFVFAAGNGGAGGRIGSPGSAKNVISAGASENARKTGRDGCGVEDLDADSAMDIAFFSSGGRTSDGRLKPDIVAPGTHVQGAASQHPEFDGSGVCGEDLDRPYFPRGQTLYTWSSGTSHSTPVIAGAAALIWQFLLDRGEQPTAALIKALLLNSTNYMTGEFAAGNLPHPRQGWGLVNLGRAFDSVPKVLVNQTHLFTASGEDFVLTGEVKDPSQPFRVTLAWSDAPGVSAFAPWVNDLDLEVSINGQTYRGNNFLGQESQPGGEPSTRDNIEAVWLPAGTVGSFAVKIRASNIAGDGVPGNSSLVDQDFALVIYNGDRRDTAVTAIERITLEAGGDGAADPGETVAMRVQLFNRSPAALTGGRATISTSTPGINVSTAEVDVPNLAGNSASETMQPFVFSVAESIECGSLIQFALEVRSSDSFSRIPFSVNVGSAQAAQLFADNIEAGESNWVHGSLIKKKKKRIDTWILSTRRARSGGSSWFTPNLSVITDANLDSLPISLPADGRNLQLVFFHTFEFERGQFDGGVIEISTGDKFEDLGPKILEGGYNGTIRDFFDNPLKGREAWVDGRMGEFQRVVVDLSDHAGKTVIIRFRIGTDSLIRGLGWHVDDVTVAGVRVQCSQ